MPQLSKIITATGQMMRRQSPFRVALAVLVVPSVVVLTVLYCLLPDNYVGTRYWIPSSSDQIRVRLHWKSDRDSNPIVRTQVGCVKSTV
jgi:hypothetical protein